MIGLGHKGVVRVGNRLKYYKSGWNRKEGKGNKDLKRRKLDQGVGTLKRGGGLEPP